MEDLIEVVDFARDKYPKLGKNVGVHHWCRKTEESRSNVTLYD